VSQRVFQAALARLVFDPEFGERVRAGGGTALPAELTDVERRRLVGAASDPGLRPTQIVHNGWRLGKLLTMLPLTSALLGPETLVAEARGFWPARPPRSLYFRDEALAFCDHLLARARAGLLAVPHLAEVTGYERAGLRLLGSPGEAGVPAPEAVPFDHDPDALLGALAAGRALDGVPASPCTLLGRRGADGAVQWSVRRL
jgi:hypothetical protein